MWKNIVELDMPQMTIRRMRIIFWIPKATNTHSEYVRHIHFPLQQRLHERTLYVPFLSCLIWNFFYCSVRVTSDFSVWVLRSGQQCKGGLLSSGVWLLFPTSVTLDSAKRSFPISKSQQFINNDTPTLIWNIPFGVATIMYTKVLNMLRFMWSLFV
jgi:hypothetical protein